MWKTGLLRWGPALLMMAVIFASSSLPREEVPEFGAWDFLVKKGGHLLGYALLAAAYLHGLAYGRPPGARHMLLAVTFAALYGASDEFHQAFVPGRKAMVADVLIDALGAMIGAGVWGYGGRLLNHGPGE
jgi:hypothetical protein